MGGLDNSSIFLSVPEAETSKIKWSKRQWGRFRFETSSLASLVDGHRLPEHTYDLSRFFLQQERERGRELSGFFIRPLILSYLDSTLKTSFDFCYLLIGPVAKYSHTGVLQHMTFGEMPFSPQQMLKFRTDFRCFTRSLWTVICGSFFLKTQFPFNSLFVTFLRNSLLHDQSERNLEVAFEVANVKPLISGA